jgi:hypothetical protein
MKNEKLIQIKTVGFLNLTTGQFFKKKSDWQKSIRQFQERKKQLLSIEFGRAFIAMCKIDAIKHKATRITGRFFSWVKSCLNATVKRLTRQVYVNCSVEVRALLF